MNGENFERWLIRIHFDICLRKYTCVRSLIFSDVLRVFLFFYNIISMKRVSGSYLLLMINVTKYVDVIQLRYAFLFWYAKFNVFWEKWKYVRQLIERLYNTLRINKRRALASKYHWLIDISPESNSILINMNFKISLFVAAIAVFLTQLSGAAAVPITPFDHWSFRRHQPQIRTHGTSHGRRHWINLLWIIL